MFVGGEGILEVVEDVGVCVGEDSDGGVGGDWVEGCEGEDWGF